MADDWLRFYGGVPGGEWDLPLPQLCVMVDRLISDPGSTLGAAVSGFSFPMGVFEFQALGLLRALVGCLGGELPELVLPDVDSRGVRSRAVSGVDVSAYRAELLSVGVVAG